MRPDSVKQNASRADGRVLLLAFVFSPLIAVAQSAGEKTFDSPGAAVLALYNAVNAGNDQDLNNILGSNSKTILHTGDDVADKNAGRKFIERYNQMHRVVIEPDQTATLYIGAENWPFAIPIAKNAGNNWYFDTEAGTKEILYRRVGKNEMDAIDTCLQFVDAQRDYFSARPDGDKTPHYAARFLSEPGQKNGLYWQSPDNDSPLGPGFASAADEGYNFQPGKSAPFHGYYFKVLTQQGAAAKGGKKDYMTNGKLTRGFGLVAWPSEYRNSGVMTFIVNQAGIVYQKNLGPDTAKIASAMTVFDPGPGWEVAQ